MPGDTGAIGGGDVEAALLREQSLVVAELVHVNLRLPGGAQADGTEVTVPTDSTTPAPGRIEALVADCAGSLGIRPGKVRAREGIESLCLESLRDVVDGNADRLR